MNKDAILATIIGFGVGLVIAGLVFLGPTVWKNMPHAHFSLPDLSAITALYKGSSKQKSVTQTKPVSHALTIESPLPESIEPQSDSLISGKTAPNAIVVLEGENGEAVAVANSQGAYAGKLSLGEGKNDLKVTSHSGKDVETQAVTVYYTPENF